MIFSQTAIPSAPWQRPVNEKLNFETPEEYREWVNSQDWYQTIRLSHDIVTPGTVRTDLREKLLSTVDVAGKRVLDVGCNSGQFCLWAKRRGAEEVVGIDLADRRLSQARTISENEGLDIDFRELSLLDAPQLGRFDVVFCFAVVTEIPDFSGAMGALKQLIGGRAVVELDLARPLVAIPGVRAFRQGRGWGELRQNKRGDWIVSPTLGTLRTVFGDEYDLKRSGKGIRYDVVQVYRKEAAGRSDLPAS